MGVTVRQKVKGRGQPWWVFIYHNGRRTSRKVGDRRAAEAVASQIRTELQLGEFGLGGKKPPPSFKEYADSWIATTVPATCKPSTLREYKDILKNHINPVFEGNQNITAITRGDIKDFLYGKLNGGFAASTVAHLRNCLSGVFNLALEHEIIQFNPAQHLGKGFLKKKDRKEDLNPLTSDELNRLLNAFKENFAEHYALALLLARTGMRIGEAFALTWGNIDFGERFIEVKQSYVRGKITSPKSGKSRQVDMSLQLKVTLQDHELSSKKKGLRLGLGDKPEYVFTNRNGGLMDQGHWRRRVFKKALRKAGLREIRIHDLRHTYATLRISKGDNIGDVSKQLGHHSVKFTLDTYYHWIPGGKKSEVDELDDPSFARPSAPYTHPK